MKNSEARIFLRELDELVEKVRSFAEKHNFRIYENSFATYLYDPVNEKAYSDKLMFAPSHILETMEMIVKLREREFKW